MKPAGAETSAITLMNEYLAKYVYVKFAKH